MKTLLKYMIIFLLFEAQTIAQEQPKPDLKAKEKPDYSNLPVAPYGILAGEYLNLKGERFRDSMHPKKIIAVPKDLVSCAGKNTKLVELKTKKGNNKAYLIVPAAKAPMFQRMIKSKQELKFVYTPVALYNSHPVLELIDVLE